MKKIILLLFFMLSLYHTSFSQLQASKNVYFINNPDVFATNWYLHDETNTTIGYDRELFKVFGTSIETLNAYVVNDGSNNDIVIYCQYDSYDGPWYYGGETWTIRNNRWAIRATQFGESSKCSGFDITCDYGVTISTGSSNRLGALIDIDQLDKKLLGAA